ncbi:hypothetical protein D9M70_625370 [compost metagenome]
MPSGGLTEYFEEVQLFSRLNGLVPELDDVHATGEGGVDEVGEVAALLAGIRAEVQAGGIGEFKRGHGNQPSSSKLGPYRGSPLQLS